MGVKKILMGNHAVSWGAMLSRVQVISAYPITPQTQIVEELSVMCASGKLNAKFIKVESEHSAMASCIGASAAGARVFTATSAQGLALMHEVLHWAALGRLPIVLANVNRAMAPGWSIWSDQTDALSQRDTGWIQWYCETNQEVLDSVIIAYKVAEKVKLPLMLVLDAFILSHTYEPVDIPLQEEVDKYLPPFKPDIYLNVDDPRAFGALTSPEHYMELRYIMQNAMNDSLEFIKIADKEYFEMFGRGYGLIEQFHTEDAEVVIVAAGSMVSTCREAIERLRSRGERAGLLKLRCFRPFPKKELREVLSKVPKIAVLDRNISVGCGGIFASEIASSLYNFCEIPKIYPFHIGIGGRDVTPENIIEIFEIVQKSKMPSDYPIWYGLKL